MGSSVVVLGRREDCVCYERYASDHSVNLHFVSLDRNDRREILSGEPSRIASAILTDLNGCLPQDVISFQDDYQEAADWLRVAFGIPHRPLLALRMLTDKTLLKQHPPFLDRIARYLEYPLSTRTSEVLTDVIQKMTFPVVVKPSNAAYSAGVMRCDSPEELEHAIRNAASISRMMKLRTGNSAILIEEYIDGIEYAIDGIIRSGQVRCLVIHEKWPRLHGPTFHEEAYISFDANRPSISNSQLVAFAVETVTLSGLDNSPFHLELRHAGGRLVLLELAPRLAGSGASTYHLTKICNGSDVFSILHSLNNRSANHLRPTGSGMEKVGLEFDFAVDKRGTLTGLSSAKQFCLDHGATAVLEYKKDGDFVDAKGMSLTSCLTAFFACSSRSDAIDLFEYIKANHPPLI